MNTKSVIPVGTQGAVTRRETNPFSLLHQEIDRLFEGVTRNIPGFATATMPSMDISETDKVIEITAELPGLEKKDVELNVADNLLTIRGEKKNEREEKNKDYHLVERSYGSFSRSVELPRRRQGRGHFGRDRQRGAQGHRAEAGAEADQADRDQIGRVSGTAER